MHEGRDAWLTPSPANRRLLGLNPAQKLLRIFDEEKNSGFRFFQASANAFSKNCRYKSSVSFARRRGAVDPG